MTDGRKAEIGDAETGCFLHGQTSGESSCESKEESAHPLNEPGWKFCRIFRWGGLKKLKCAGAPTLDARLLSLDSFFALDSGRSTRSPVECEAYSNWLDAFLTLASRPSTPDSFACGMQCLFQQARLIVLAKSFLGFESFCGRFSSPATSRNMAVCFSAWRGSGLCEGLPVATRQKGVRGCRW